MPRPQGVFYKKLKEYKARMRNKGLTERYITEVDRAIKRCVKILKEHNQLVHPRNLTEHHLAIIRESIPFGMNGTQNNKRRHIELLRSFLRWTGCELEPLQWPEHVPKRPALPSEDFSRVMQGCYEAKDIRGATVMLLLSLSARRIAVLRAKPEDIQTDRILLKDKGHGGGKERLIPLRPEDHEQLHQYLRWRQQEIQRVLLNNSKASIPEGLIIWTRKNAMGTVGKTSLDNIIKKCGRRVGIHLTSHMPRRMMSRDLYQACKEIGEPIETAMEITGHKDKDTFLIYVGAIEDNKRALMDKVMENRKRLMYQIRGKAEKASP